MLLLLFSAEIIYTQPVCNGPDEFERRKLAPWVDITRYITDAHRAQGYIELTVQVDVDPPYVSGGGDSGDSFYFAKDDDLYGDTDIRAVCDGVRYEMIVSDLKKGAYSSYPVQPGGGQNQDGIWAPQDNKITLRFEVPYDVNNYYKIFIGNNFKPWRRGGSTYQGKILYEEPSPGPYAHAEFPGIVVKGVNVEFDGSGSLEYKSTGDIVLYEWDLGDGTTLSGEKVTHSYETAGTYNITLTVTDSLGYTNKWEGTIQVVDKAPQFQFKGVYPNPIDLRTFSRAKIGIDVDSSGSYRIKIYTATHRLVASWEEELSPGYWELDWEPLDGAGNSLPAGIYYIVVSGPSGKQVKKFYIIR